LREAPEKQFVRQIAAILKKAQAKKAEIAAALGIHTTGLEERLAFPATAPPATAAATAATTPAVATSFESFTAGSGSSECDKGHSEENGGFEELHGYGSEDGGDGVDETISSSATARLQGWTTSFTSLSPLQC